MKKLVYLVAVALVALTSCKDAKQSELKMTAKAGEATITGQVVYDAGYVLEGTEIVKAVRPLESGKVVVMMDYDQLGTGEGTRQFTGEIVNGVYAVNVPVSLKSVEVKIKVEPFMDVYGDLNAKNEIVATSAFFKAANPITVVGLIVNETRKLDLITMKADKMYNPTREQAVVIAGLVEKQKISDPMDKEPLANAPLFVSVTYGDKELIYNVKTNADGEYTVNMKLFDDWKLDQIKVSVESKYFTAKGKNSADKKCEGYYDTYKSTPVALDYSAYTKQQLDDIYLPFVETKVED